MIYQRHSQENEKASHRLEANIFKMAYLIINGYPKYPKNLYNSTIRTWTTQLKNRQNISTDISPKKICRKKINI